MGAGLGCVQRILHGEGRERPEAQAQAQGRAAREPLPRPTIQLASALDFCHCQEMRLNRQSVMWKEDKVHPSDPLPTYMAAVNHELVFKK